MGHVAPLTIVRNLNGELSLQCEGTTIEAASVVIQSGDGIAPLVSIAIPLSKIELMTERDARLH